MKIAFDEHIPKEMVDVFRTLASGEYVLAHEFCYAGDYAFNIDNGDDAPWMIRFAEDGGKIVITGDVHIRAKLHQRKAYMDCGLAVFMFPPKWSGWKLITKCAFLMKWWPVLESSIEKVAIPSCWQIPAYWMGSELKDVTGPAKD